MSHLLGHGHPRPLQTIRRSRRIGQRAKTLWAHLCHRRHSGRALRRRAIHRRHRHARRPGRCLRLPDVSGTHGRVLLSLAHPQRRGLGSCCRPYCRHPDRPHSGRIWAPLGRIPSHHSQCRLGHLRQLDHCPARLKICLRKTTENAKNAKNTTPSSRAVSGLTDDQKKWVTPAWILTVLWFLIGFGPFATVGNTLFSDPNTPATWAPFGLPSLWVWQLIMLLFGIFVMWMLAFKVGLSKPVPIEDVTSQREAFYKK